MRSVNSLLGKAIVQQFYIINAGFFLFLFFFFFGMVNGGQLLSYHYSLILSMIGSPIFMGVVWIGWLLYNIKCILFCTNSIRAAESTYLFSLKSVAPSRQWRLYLSVAVSLYLPILIYSAFVVYIASSKSMTWVACAVILYQIFMVVLCAMVFYTVINRNNIPSRSQKLLSFISSLYNIPLGYTAFILAHIFHSRKVPFAIVKTFSLLLLSVSFIRNGDHFDEDFFSIFFQVILTAHTALVFYCASFVETQLAFSRNLPLQLWKVAATYLFTYAIIFLPEFTFLLINNHGNLSIIHIITLYFTGIAVLFLYTAIQYAAGLNMERSLFLVFMAFIMIFFLQKSGYHVAVMLAIAAISAMVFKSHYYGFEKEEE